MHTKNRTRNVVLTGAAALGMALGSVGVGWAINPTTTPAVAPTTQVSQATGQGSDTVIAESQEANEAPETGGETRDVQDPSYATSISAPQAEGVSEADEAKALESLATISPDQARDAAHEAVPGTAGKVELDNENGAIVYSVEIIDSSGSDIDVKVDAGDGTILSQQADDGDDDEATEVDSDDVQDENENGSQGGNEAEDIRDD